MSRHLQIILIIWFIVVLFYLINMLCKENLDLRYSLVWIGIDLTIIILCLFPQLIDRISNLLGISTAINVIFLFGFIIQIYFILVLIREQSKMQKKTRQIAQKMAILQNKLEKGGNTNAH